MAIDFAYIYYANEWSSMLCKCNQLDFIRNGTIRNTFIHLFQTKTKSSPELELDTYDGDGGFCIYNEDYSELGNTLL